MDRVFARKFIVLLTLILLPAFLFAEELHSESIFVPVDAHGLHISHKFQYIAEDESLPPLTLEQARLIPGEQWTQLNHNPSFKGRLGSRYWYKTTLKFIDGFTGFIEMDRPINDDMAAYIIHSSQQLSVNSVNNDDIKQYQLGDMYPFSTRPVDHHNMVVPIQAKRGGEITVYLRTASSITPNQEFEANLWSETNFWSHTKWVSMLLGLYCGAIFVAVFYNLFIYFAIKEVAYLYYVGLTLLTSSIAITVLGLSYQYIWPNSPQWNSTFFGWVVPASRLFTFLFCLRFLGLSERLPKAAFLLKMFIALDIFFMLGYPLDAYSKLYKLLNEAAARQVTPTSPKLTSSAFILKAYFITRGMSHEYSRARTI